MTRGRVAFAFDVHEAGRRWLAGEGLEALAAEYRVAITTVRRKVHAAGYRLPTAELVKRQNEARARGRAEKAAALNTPDALSVPKADPLLAALQRVHP